MNTPIKVYLDHDMISAMGKKDMPLAEQSALEAICRAAEDAQCKLCTSEVSAEELAPYNGKAKPKIELAYEATSKVPYTDRQKFLGCHSFGDQYTWISAPMIEDNPEWLRVRKLKLKDKDAHHVMLAGQAKCDVFLTRDQEILDLAEAILKQETVLPMKPTTLCQKMGWA